MQTGIDGVVWALSDLYGTAVGVHSVWPPAVLDGSQGKWPMAGLLFFVGHVTAWSWAQVCETKFVNKERGGPFCEATFVTGSCGSLIVCVL